MARTSELGPGCPVAAPGRPGNFHRDVLTHDVTMAYDGVRRAGTDHANCEVDEIIDDHGRLDSPAEIAVNLAIDRLERTIAEDDIVVQLRSTSKINSLDIERQAVKFLASNPCPSGTFRSGTSALRTEILAALSSSVTSTTVAICDILVTTKSLNRTQRRIAARNMALDHPDNTSVRDRAVLVDLRTAVSSGDCEPAHR